VRGGSYTVTRPEGTKKKNSPHRGKPNWVGKKMRGTEENFERKAPQNDHPPRQRLINLIVNITQKAKPGNGCRIKKE